MDSSRDEPGRCALSDPTPLSTVGLLAIESLWAPLGGGSPDDFLSSMEREWLSGIRHPRRRREWLGGRILAKYLLLSGASPSRVARIVGAGQLRSIPASEYRALNVLRGPRGAPEFRRRGALAARALSLSHAGPWVVAALAADGAIGVDCERVEARHEAFVRRSFVEAERAWVARHAAPQGPSADWLHTLLWSFKEAAYKTGCVAGERAIEIQLRPDEGLPIGTPPRFEGRSRELMALNWRVNGLAPHFACTALPGSVLVIVHFPGVRRCN